MLRSRPCPRRDRARDIHTSPPSLAEELGRALAVRHVDTGSCNGCELEIQALGNAIYNLAAIGVRLVASPRHADILLVTGPVARAMAAPLRATYDAVPAPKRVVALGDCACGCGVYSPNYATVGKVDDVIPVDVAIPGCPPPPETIREAFATLICR
ncbi:hypothetical protein [Acidiferrobacter sp.]|uniref:NADH-quinone oxidoreductase subunit B family protein n=1 Tax=Acidiferrobacter sp. TaxID=1872107 RepID=UPI00261D8A6F|nr:hypothetical protein [Acidiferrobacter sp.]